MVSLMRRCSVIRDGKARLLSLHQYPRNRSTIRGIPLVPNDPTTAWIREGEPPASPVKDHKTLAGHFKEIFHNYSDRECLGRRGVVYEEWRNGVVISKQVLEPEYKWLTYAQVDAKVDILTKGLLSIGVKPKDVVSIFMETRQEWLLTFLALNRLGATVATMYNTLGDEGLTYGVNLVESPVLVTSSLLLPRIVKVLDSLRHITTIVHVENLLRQGEIDGELLKKRAKVLTMEQLENQGEAYREDYETYEASPDDDVVIMFTSGTTGTPKGVVMDNRAMLASQRAIASGVHKLTDRDTCVAFLPLAHIFELLTEMGSLTYGIRLGYSSPFTIIDKAPGLADDCPGDISLLKPTFMVAVPLFLDRIRKGVLNEVGAMGNGVSKIFQYAMKYKGRLRGRGVKTPLLDRLIFDKVRVKFGGELKYIYSGGAPISPDIQIFIESCLGVQVIPTYGATEVTGGICALPHGDTSVGRVGPPLAGVALKLASWPEGGYYPSDKPNPRGEILISTKSLAKCYYKNDEATKNAFFTVNGERWYKSGDIGEMCPDGFLKVIDRASDVIKLANGEFISLGKIEITLMNNDYVENICIYGDSRYNYTVALMSPNRERLKPIINLDDQGALYGLEHGQPVNKKILESLDLTLRKARMRAHEVPKKVKVCLDEWSPATGLLTPALKIRRKNIYSHYQNDIRRFYEE